MSDQMAEALRGMAEHRAASWAVDRRDWTDQEWINDAHRLMGDVDGSVSSLLNGHVNALLRAPNRETAAAVAALTEAADRIEASRSQHGIASRALDPGRAYAVAVLREMADRAAVVDPQAGTR